MNPILTKAISKKLKCVPVNANPDPTSEPSSTPEPAELPLESESCANQYCKEGRMSGIWPNCICESTPAPGPRPPFELEDAADIQIAIPCLPKKCYQGKAWVGYPYCSCMMKFWETA